MKVTRRCLLGVAWAAAASSVIGRPAHAAAQLEFKLGVNTPENYR
jgi:hypothetical protein